jgi:hypothetical protein
VAVKDKDTRRFLLTDKAFYVFTPDGTDARIRRYAIGTAAELRRTPYGEPELRFGADRIPLDAVPGSGTLLRRMGLMEETHCEGGGIAVPG